jgi:hypothetical protein
MMKIFRAPPLPTRITLAIAGFFVLCQVMGVMCAIPDLAMAGEERILSQEGIVCPMDGTIMCPPSATSSPERQVKYTLTLDSDHAPTVLVSATAVSAPLIPTLWSWSSACPIVPISIASSSVLRI